MMEVVEVVLQKDAAALRNQSRIMEITTVLTSLSYLRGRLISKI